MGEYLRSEEFTNGKDGELQFVVDNSTIVMVVGASKFSATSTPKVITRGQIGTRNAQSKITSFENKIALTADYYLVGTIRDWLIRFKRTGKWPKIDMMAVNHDRGTSLGRMSTRYKDLVLDGDIPLQSLDEAADNGLTLDLSFKFSDWDPMSEFDAPAGIGRE